MESSHVTIYSNEIDGALVVPDCMVFYFSIPANMYESVVNAVKGVNGLIDVPGMRFSLPLRIPPEIYEDLVAAVIKSREMAALGETKPVTKILSYL